MAILNRTSSLSSSSESNHHSSGTLQEASKKHHEAHECMQQGRYSEALVLLNHTLRIKTTYQTKPPFICIVDIITIHVDMGHVLKSMSLYTEASIHFYKAWKHYSKVYGLDHQLTKDAESQWIQTNHQGSILLAALNDSAPAA
jgi:hypothetical protein|eukprot:762310_1